MRLNGILIKMFTKILIELYKNMVEIYEILGIFCRNKFQDEESLEKIPYKCWRNFRETSEKSWPNLKNNEKILKNVKIFYEQENL